MTVDDDLEALRREYIEQVADMAHPDLIDALQRATLSNSYGNHDEMIAIIRDEMLRRMKTVPRRGRERCGMKRKRDRSGVYRSGLYQVERMATNKWYADGPGVDGVYDRKADAQAACQEAERA